MFKEFWLSTFFFLSCFFFASSHDLQANPSQEIRVHLSTENPLAAIYISKIQADDDGSLNQEYLSDLSAVFEFDFHFNGKTRVVSKSIDREKILLQKDTEQALNPQQWKNFGIPYVIKASIKNRKLQVITCNSLQGTIRNFPEIPLTGTLSIDRRSLHKLADSIYKSFFNKDGVANSRILFSSQYKNPNSDGSHWISEIWECDWDGANLKQLTKENSYCITPVLINKSASFFKDMFLYVSYKTGQPKIFISSVENGKGKRAIDLRGNQLLPAMSKQRDKLAFICDASGRTDLFLTPLKPETGEVGTPVQLFSYPRATQASPTFNPDGSKVAFVSDKDGSPRIYIIPATRGGKRPQAELITKKNKENSCPSWSPDGTKLAYSAKTENIRQIWIYDFTTGEEWQLTEGSGNKENPCWAPDSMHIVFNSTDGASSDLYIVNLHQPEAIKITKGPGKKHYPTWGQR